MAEIFHVNQHPTKLFSSTYDSGSLNLGFKSPDFSKNCCQTHMNRWTETMCCFWRPALSSVLQGLSSFWFTWKILPTEFSDLKVRKRGEKNFSCMVLSEQETDLLLTSPGSPFKLDHSSMEQEGDFRVSFQKNNGGEKQTTLSLSAGGEKRSQISSDTIRGCPLESHAASNLHSAVACASHYTCQHICTVSSNV